MSACAKQAILSVEHLSLCGPLGAPILDDVSFDIDKGEILALVGESGSGKTMAARAAMRLLPAGVASTGGRLLFEGREILTMPDRELRRVRGARIGMVFQEPMVSLNPAIRIGVQLIEALRLHQRISAADARRRAIEMLTRVRIGDPVGCMGAFPHQFSGGMRQRIMLASVMLLRPSLLIADEPTTALDTLAQREVLELMVELTRDADTAVLLITHNLGLVAQYAHRIVVLERGRLIEKGTVAETLGHPKEPYTRKLIAAIPQREKARRRDGSERSTLIEARNVSIAFRQSGGIFRSSSQKRVVKDVDLALRAGETVAVVGGSGSGKTTLGRAMLGLLPLAGGEVHFEGQNVAKADAQAARRFRLNAQLVFQDPYSSLNPRQRIIDIVREPLLLDPSLSDGERDEQVRLMLAEVGLNDFGSRFPHALSGGQRQRVAIARAVIRNPLFIVADEAVSALDMTIQKQILDLLARMQTQHAFACLFISHDRGAVAQIADRIVVMQDGEIVEQGSVDQILDQPQHAYTKALIEASPALAATARVAA